jgi:hypothetical protein
MFHPGENQLSMIQQSFQKESHPQQPGPAVGPQKGGGLPPLEDPLTAKLLKTWAIFLPPHFGQVSFNPFSFSAMVARTSILSLHSIQTYS